MGRVEHLPPEEERAWLLGELGYLVGRQGVDTFVSAPLVLPTKEFFPEPFAFTVGSLTRLADRLLVYSGLWHLSAEVKPFRASDDEDDRSAAFFAGIQGRTCLFGFNETVQPAPDYVAGVLAHEVAHAWRAVHGLAVPDGDTEELLTDLTTVFLGFGVLTTNTTWRYRSSGGLRGSFVETRWRTDRAGYLPPQAMSFALGAQLVVRGAREEGGGQARLVLSHLEPNQSAFCRAAMDHLEQDSGLCSRLGAGDPGTWPPSRGIPRLKQGPSAPDDEEPLAAPEENEKFNEGRPVFRLRTAQAGTIAGPGLLIGLLLGFVLELGWPSVFPPWTVVATAFTGFVTGLFAGWNRTSDLCSDVECREVLPEEARVCPRCGGVLSGVITNPEKRLELEDRILAVRRKHLRKVE
ncbi:MAG: hypothetical protein JNK60_17080 [Acidobacteria bacterium]|nr:hypothetical protein [Acidobacteriota bacterium]